MTDSESRLSRRQRPRPKPSCASAAQRPFAATAFFARFGAAAACFVACFERPFALVAGFVGAAFSSSKSYSLGAGLAKLLSAAAPAFELFDVASFPALLVFFSAARQPSLGPELKVQR